METSEVLNKAADLIEERGWGTGPMSMLGRSGLCIMGAVVGAHYGALAGSEGIGIRRFVECPAGQAVTDYLGQPSPYFVWRYNDSVGRTAAEVIEVLRACALIESAREEQDAAWATYADEVSA